MTFNGSPTRRKVEMRRFRLVRNQDETGISGTGYVAEGVQFSDGQCVISWLTETSSMGIYHSIVEMLHIHGHGGKTTVEWIDDKDGAGDPATDPNSRLEEKLANVEKKEIATALENTENRTEAAEKLGLSRQGLANKMKKYGLLSENSEKSGKEEKSQSE